MVSVGGVLYMAVQDLRCTDNGLFDDAPAASIYKSTDKGRTWTGTSEPMFKDYVFTTIMFLDYGQDNGNSPDGYVYAYGLDYNWRDSFTGKVADPTNLYLARVPGNSVQDRSKWEFFSGTSSSPSWSRDIGARKPGFVGFPARVRVCDRGDDGHPGYDGALPGEHRVQQTPEPVYLHQLDRVHL